MPYLTKRYELVKVATSLVLCAVLCVSAAQAAPRWVDFGGAVLWPGYWQSTSAPAFGNATTINDGNDNLWYIFTIPKDGYITDALFRVGSVTTGEDLLVDLQSVNEGMYKSGTRLHAGDTAIIAVASGDANSALEVDFDAIGDSAQVTRGQVIALVVRKDRSDPDAINLQVTKTLNAPSYLFPIAADSTTAINAVISGIPACGIKINQKAVNVGTMPIDSASSITIYDSTAQHASNPDEVGVIYTPRFPCIVEGMDVQFRNTVSAAHFTGARYAFYNGTTLYDSISFTADSLNNNQSGIAVRYSSFRKPCTLLVGGTYRFTIKPTDKMLDSDTGLIVYWYSVSDTSWWYGTNAGPELHWTQRDDGGSFTQIDNRRPMLNLRIVQLSADAGDSGRRRRKLLMEGKNAIWLEAQETFAGDKYDIPY